MEKLAQDFYNVLQSVACLSYSICLAIYKFEV